MSLIYAYGFARSVERTGLAGVENAPVEQIDHGDIALLGSPIEGEAEPDPWEGVVAHNRVLSEALANGPVVPLQPGYLMERGDCQALLESEHQRVDRLLHQFAGRVEAKVQFSYHNEDTIVREIVAEQPQLARSTGSYGERIRVGEEIVSRLAQKREQDSRPLLESLKPCSEATVLHDQAELSVLNASFLVDQANVPQFEQALGQLEAQHGKRMALKYIAPVPFYSFVEQG